MEQYRRHSTNKKLFSQAGEKTSVTVPGPTLTDLPPRDTVRWVSRHKATIVAAVQTGVISLNDARRRYDLSVEELLSWEGALAKFGTIGLHVEQTRLGRHSHR